MFQEHRISGALAARCGYSGRMLRSDDIVAARFSTVRWREGYETGEVDDLLARALIELRGWEQHARATALAAADVVNARFQPTRLRTGYDQDQVDEFLEALSTTLRKYESRG